MPRSRPSMRQIRESLRLKRELGISDHPFASNSSLSRPTVTTLFDGQHSQKFWTYVSLEPEIPALCIVESGLICRKFH